LKKGQKLGQSRRMRGIRKLLSSTLDNTIWGDKIVIVAAQGAVLGQGFAFAMAADLLILSERSLSGADVKVVSGLPARDAAAR